MGSTLFYSNSEIIFGTIAATESARLVNEAQSKCRWWKMRDWKIEQKNVTG